MKNIFEVLKAENYPEIRTVKVSRSETLFREEDLCVYLGIVKKGQVEIVSYSFEGKEIIFNVINPNEMFGNNLLFSSNPYYKGNVVATVDTELILINKKTLLNILQTNSEFLNLYLEHSSNNVIALNAKIKLLSLDNAKERFI